jgi:hypothetical protein
MNTLAPGPPAAATQRWPVPGASVWLGLLAALCVAGLLLAFQRVVSQSMQRSAARQRAAAAMAEATWRCDALEPLRQRVACRAQLNPAP